MRHPVIYVVNYTPRGQLPISASALDANAKYEEARRLDIS